MSVTDALKRIEEKHWPVGGLRYCGGCRDAHMRDGPCDVVKLARVLAQTLEFLDDLEASAVFDEWSIDNEPRAAGAYMLHAEVKRTLEEGAGAAGS
jgi:hypothetical protein